MSLLMLWSWLYMKFNSVLCDSASGSVLVLGGQGVAGTATLTALLDSKFQVSALNDDTAHYDYHDLFKEKVESIVCERSAGLDGCSALQTFLSSNKKVKAIVDFTSTNKKMMEEAVRVLTPLKPDVYILVSSAAVYDVSDNAKQPLEESAAVRPVDQTLEEDQSKMNDHAVGHDMLSTEEALVESGLPHVILRCGDLIGPRDTTYRWWQYQVWLEHFAMLDIAIPVPSELKDLQYSLTYGDDVGKAVVSVIKKGVVNGVYNIAIEKLFTFPHFLLELCTFYGNGGVCWADYNAADDAYSLYPTNFKGTLSIERAKEDLDFVPTSWEDVLRDTTSFYQTAIHNHSQERDIVLSRLSENVVPAPLQDPLKEAVLAVGLGEDQVLELEKPESDNKVEL